MFNDVLTSPIMTDEKRESYVLTPTVDDVKFSLVYSNLFYHIFKNSNVTTRSIPLIVRMYLLSATVPLPFESNTFRGGLLLQGVRTKQVLNYGPICGPVCSPSVFARKTVIFIAFI